MFLISWDSHTHTAESLESGPNRAMETPSEEMGRLVQADQNPTVTRITGVYTRGEEKSMSEWKARRTFEQMGHDRSRPHQVWVKDRSLWFYRVQDETFRGCGYTPGTIFKNTIFRCPVSVTLLCRVGQRSNARLFRIGWNAIGIKL